MNKENKPLLVDLTPVFNEAWVLSAFLKATSLWADYIIIADQMSTDGSRELYQQFSKEEHINLHGRKCELIVIDNPRKEMHQAATRRLLFEEAKKIEGDKILFTLDADEFLSGNFPETEGWRTIMNSEPGDVFCFYWMNLDETGEKYYKAPKPFYWSAHTNEDLLEGTFPDNFIHEWRLPWPNQVSHEYVIEDIFFLHFRRMNIKRQSNKARNYQVLQYSHPSNKHGGVSFFRQYNCEVDKVMKMLPKDAFIFYQYYGVNILSELDFSDEGEHYTRTVLEKLHEYGISTFKKLDIWDESFLRKYNIEDPRGPIDKLMHHYLRATQKISQCLLIKVLDKILKKVY